MAIHEECGVIGVYDPAGSCARTAYYGLYALQHRGQEACGIATINNRELSFHKDVGLVGEVFDSHTLEELNGTMAVGHVRCSTTKGHLCIFEYIYFARPDSVICGQSVHQARRLAGRFLAQENPVEADVVIGVPDSGLDAAMGYAEESGIPYGIGLVKNRYIGRTFITPDQQNREQAVRIKLGPLRSCVEGRRVVMIDDSIVRGTTSRQIVSLLREAGAKEVHLCSSAPPFVSPCYFGTDIPSKEELIACRYSIEEIRAQIGADSLAFLSLNALHKIAPDAGCGFCDGCFTGAYPINEIF